MRRYQEAFTIIELMVTLAVLAVVIGVAIPSFNSLIRNNRAVGLGEELTSALNFARSEAVKRGRRVSMCASLDGSKCDGAWNNGWIVFVDGAVADHVTPPVIADPPAVGVLRYWDNIADDANITVKDNKTFVRFTGLGTLGRVGVNPGVEIKALITGCSVARQITVGVSGVVNVARIDC